MPSLNVNILLHADSRDDITRIATLAKAAGLNLGESGILAAIGALHGSIDAKSLHRLRRIPGVQSVEIDRAVGALDTSADPKS
jgi:hypothetical protein